MLVDSHCHLDRLDLTGLGISFDTVLANAEQAGVSHMLCICINLQDFPRVRQLAHQYPHIFASVGVHPSEDPQFSVSPEQLLALANDPEVIAIGETGLDYYWNEGDLEWQRERFRSHIQVAKQVNKPLIIHTRDAQQDTLRILREEGADQPGGVMHCFTGDQHMADQSLEQGFYISLSGIVTFKNARDLQAVARTIPDDRLLVETDCPYLTPVPYRGKPNQPAYVRQVAEYLADLRGVSVEHIMAVTTENFFRLFQSAKQ